MRENDTLRQALTAVLSSGRSLSTVVTRALPGKSAPGIARADKVEAEPRRDTAQCMARLWSRAVGATNLDHESIVYTTTSPEALRLLTLKETAQRLAVCKRTLERLIIAGQFPRPLKIGRSVRIAESDLQAYITTLRADAPPLK